MEKKMIKDFLTKNGINSIDGDFAIIKLFMKPWLLFAEKEDAVLTFHGNLVVWHSGTWKGGKWKNGIFLDGFFENGIWKNGLFKGRKFSKSVFKKGIFLRGKFSKSIFENGKYYTNGDTTWFSSKWIKGYRNNIFTNLDPLKEIASGKISINIGGEER